MWVGGRTYTYFRLFQFVGGRTQRGAQTRDSKKTAAWANGRFSNPGKAFKVFWNRHLTVFIHPAVRMNDWYSLSFLVAAQCDVLIKSDLGDVPAKPVCKMCPGRMEEVHDAPSRGAKALSGTGSFILPGASGLIAFIHQEQDFDCS